MTVIYSLFSLSLSFAHSSFLAVLFNPPPHPPTPLAVCMLAAPLLMDYTFLGLF